MKTFKDFYEVASAKISKKVAKKLQKLEVERVKKAKAAMKDA